MNCLAIYFGFSAIQHAVNPLWMESLDLSHIRTLAHWRYYSRRAQDWMFSHRRENGSVPRRGATTFLLTLATHFNSGAAINSNQRCIGVIRWNPWAYNSVTFEGLPHDQQRYSMAYFCGANNDTVLQPLLSNLESKKLIGWDGKPIGNITAGEYYAQVFDNLYEGLSPSKPVVASSWSLDSFKYWARGLEAVKSNTLSHWSDIFAVVEQKTFPCADSKFPFNKLSCSPISIIAV